MAVLRPMVLTFFLSIEIFTVDEEATANTGGKRTF
jgi:hypothetical protein